jgi:hypothetical protein
MKYLGKYRPLLGPCRCRGCGDPVFWARGNTSEGDELTTWLTWRNVHGHVHRHDGRQRRSKLTPAGTGRLAHPQLRHESVHHGL